MTGLSGLLGIGTAGWICAALAGLGGAVLMRPSLEMAPRPLAASSPITVGTRHSGSSTVRLAVLSLVAAIALSWVVGPLAWAGAIAVAGGWRLAVLGRRRRVAAATGAAIAELCQVLASELRAGRPPSTALAEAVGAWSPLATAVRAEAMGLSVPAALRGLAEHPGACELRWVASAWQLSAESGQGLGLALTRVSDTLREASRTRRVVAAELASARSTSRLLAILPLPALLLGSGAGGDPWSFLLSSPVGAGCLVVGVTLQLAGLLAIEAIAESVERSC